MLRTYPQSGNYFIATIPTGTNYFETSLSWLHAITEATNNQDPHLNMVEMIKIIDAILNEKTIDEIDPENNQLKLILASYIEPYKQNSTKPLIKTTHQHVTNFKEIPEDEHLGSFLAPQCFWYNETGNITQYAWLTE